MAQDDLTQGGSVRPMTRWGEPVMHEKTAPVTEFGEELHTLIRDMFATMRASDGVGLAATQVGVGLSVFIYQCPDADDVVQVGVVCNPVITVPEGVDRQLEAADEGCLSFPGGYAQLARPDKARCVGQDPWGRQIEVQGTGLLARCLQHETDHLNGTVFGDRLSARARRQLDAKVAELAWRYPDDWPVSPKAPHATPVAAE
ncbi:peptide deformylase [Tessaracoccus sp. Z1128]